MSKRTFYILFLCCLVFYQQPNIGLISNLQRSRVKFTTYYVRTSYVRYRRTQSLKIINYFNIFILSYYTTCLNIYNVSFFTTNSFSTLFPFLAVATLLPCSSFDQNTKVWFPYKSEQFLQFVSKYTHPPHIYFQVLL